MIIFNFGAKFVAVCQTVYVSMEYLETNIEQIRLGKRKLYSSYDRRYAKANFSRSITRGFFRKEVYDYFARNKKSIKEVIWKLIVLTIIKMHIHNLCGKVSHSL